MCSLTSPNDPSCETYNVVKTTRVRYNVGLTCGRMVWISRSSSDGTSQMITNVLNEEKRIKDATSLPAYCAERLPILDSELFQSRRSVPATGRKYCIDSCLLRSNPQ